MLLMIMIKTLIMRNKVTWTLDMDNDLKSYGKYNAIMTLIIMAIKSSGK